ncbi:LysR substrate-binding domain-containing protein [Ramlibacter sp. WS9]|uniref:LysR substrate-binding domain-containing protein n=1 Tax=Ramlibacter sp. WS9 TaxID=1882741 RepID=UPI0011447764|nr:LysR substrate-binding domain-containing protein [Ramlibacter sp. WS9]ROZ71308.1 hypothetical protein EEB15_21960 [Ramlibacter sp. WS9]
MTAFVAEHVAPANYSAAGGPRGTRACVRLASAGLGLAVVPLQAAQSEIAAGRLQVIDVRPALPQTTVVLMYRKVSAIYMDAIQMLDDAVAAEGA